MTMHSPLGSAVLCALLCFSFACTDDPGDPKTEDDAGPADTEAVDAGPEKDAEPSKCPAGKSCDDGNPCTEKDTCNKSDVCEGKPTDGGKCDDGSKCSDKDTCKAGKCEGAAIVCDDKDPCTKDVCDPDKGCDFSDKQTGIDCNDGNACTTGDKCFAGKCQAGKTVKSCTAGGPCELSSCDPKTGNCVNKNAADGKTCDAGDKCIQGAVCKSGLCAGKAKDCDDKNACTLDSCKKADGKCENDSKAMDDKPCDDGDKCTTDDACKAGKCDKSTPKACNDGNVCTKDGCKDGKCTTTITPDVPCDDTNTCTKDDKCRSTGKCGGTDICDCKKDADCKDDGNACNGVFKCDTSAGKCKIDAATVVTCKATGNVCTINACVTKTGKCVVTNAASTVACDDGSKCTKSDKCSGGTCAGTTVSCGSGKPCAGVSCDPAKGCVTKTAKDGDPCDADGDACTVGDQCQGGACTKGKSTTCDDKNPCTVDKCDAKTGKCGYAADKSTDGASCDADGSVCTVKDACKSGKCIAGNTKVCDDANACTDNVCDKTKGCQFKSNAAPCDDGDKCTTGDACSGSKCTAGKAVTCDDKDKCTTDKCDSKKGCTYTQISGCNSTNKTWLVMIYMAADNNLETSALADINELINVTGADHLTFAVQIDRADGYSSDKVGGIADFKTTKRLVIAKGKLSEIKDLGETNTGDSKHLEEFIAWAGSTYKADRNVLVLWNHGHAWQGFGGDDSSSNNDALTLKEMGDGIKAGLSGAKISKLDVIGFDACLMASLTTAQVMSPYADYMLASEDLEPGHGWDHSAWDTVAKKPNTPITDVGKAIIDAYKKQAEDEQTSSSITLALLDLAKLTPVTDAVKAIADSMGKDLEKLATKMGQSRDSVQEFGRSDNPEDAYFQIDVGDMSEQMANLESGLGTLKDNLLKALSGLVVHSVAGVVTAEATGIALYFPPLEKYYLDKFKEITGVDSWRSTVTGFYGEADKIDYQPTFEHDSDDSGSQAGDNAPPKHKPLGMNIANLSKPIGGNGTGKEVLELPYIEDFKCNSQRADKWVYVNAHTAKGVKSAAAWGVDLTPRGPGHSCTLNFNDGKGYICTSSGKGIEAYAITPWLNVKGHALLYVGVVPSGFTQWHPTHTLAVELSPDGIKWRELKFMMGPERGSATVLLPKAFPGVTKVKLRLRFTTNNCNKTLFGKTVKVKNPKTGKLEDVFMPSIGPAVSKIVVFSPGNPCESLGKGSWCNGQEVITCDASKLIESRTACDAACDPNGGKGSAKCKTETKQGDVTITCGGKGVIKLQAKMDTATSKNLARARLRYGYTAPARFKPPGAPDDSGQRKAYPQFFGSVAAEIGKDGTIRANWDQNVLVARHPRGNTILYTKRRIKGGVDHNEAPIRYVEPEKSKCPCEKKGDKGYNDKDGDGISDCIDNDADGDGVLNIADNCPWISNADQKKNNKGVPTACPKGQDDGKPSYTCEPRATSAGWPGVWHIDLDVKTGALISQTVYVKKPYGISAVTPRNGAFILAQMLQETGAENPAFSFTRGATFPNPRIAAHLLDKKSLFFDSMPLSHVPFLVDKTQTQSGGKFIKECYKPKPAIGNRMYCSRGSGAPLSVYDVRNLGDVWLQLTVEDIGGNGDAVVYQGSIPADCYATLTACPSGKKRDCLGSCVDAKHYGNGKCDYGVELGPHLRCPETSWDGGDCSDCPNVGEIRDCQGRCFDGKLIDAALGNGRCNDGAQDLFPPIADRIQGPDLRCLTYSFDEGDCTPGKPTLPGLCPGMNEIEDCEGQCIDIDKIAEAPLGSVKCRSRFACDRFEFDGSACGTKGLGCPTTVPGTICNNNGTCSFGKCKCKSGWRGAACNVPDVKATCCKAHTSAGCADSWVQSCVCQRDSSCCKKAWATKCVALAAKHCRPQCGARKSCSTKLCGAPNNDPPKSIAVGRAHACMIGKLGTVRCWGEGSGGKLGNAKTISYKRPTPVVALKHMLALDAGNNHTCGIRKVKLGAKTLQRVLCWGYNDYGQLGDGSKTDRLLPTSVKGLNAATAVATAHDHTCAINNKKLFCWGKSDEGQVGTGTTHIDYSAPQAILKNVNVNAVATGIGHTCVRTNAGATYCFGSQRFGQIGNGKIDKNNAAKPTLIKGTGVIKGLCTGGYHTCAIRNSDSSVWCWGRNNSGQIGKAAGNPVTKPYKVPGIKTAQQITCGKGHTCVLLSNKTVLCWGNNEVGQTGDYTLESHHMPKPVRAGVNNQVLKNIIEVRAGDRNTCARDSGGELSCWGANGQGQLGRGRLGHRMCEPSCLGKECGANGCGGTCGECDPGESCLGNACIQCVPRCKNKDGSARVCGSDGCGGNCGKLGGGCQKGQKCDHETGKCSSFAECKGQCGDWKIDPAGLPLCYCGPLCLAYGLDPQTNKPSKCCAKTLQEFNALAKLCPECQKQCTGKMCGPDGCGGDCGACPDGLTCNVNNGKCQDPCTPNCAGRECGDDGCGGACGTCKPGVVCTAAAKCAKLACVPLCSGKECGPDGCGGWCGGKSFGGCTLPKKCNLTTGKCQ